MLTGKERYRIAVVGATGGVGNEIIDLLEQRAFPVEGLRLFASADSAGEELEFEESAVPVETLDGGSFREIDIAFFSAGTERSRAWAPLAVRSGCVVVDTSACWRMEANVPLVVPEVNPHDLSSHRGIIASPGSAVTQLVVALKPLHEAAGVRRIVVTTLQSVSEKGKKGMDELLMQTTDLLSFREIRKALYPDQIAFNVLPYAGEFLEGGYTSEEMQTIRETQKIMGEDTMRVSATVVTVPVFRCHCQAVTIETEGKLTANEARALLAAAPGVIVFDAPDRTVCPFPLTIAGRDEVYVGRIREDESADSGLSMWIVADNLRKGSALNAVQIAETLIALA